MNLNILDKDVQAFIDQQLGKDPLPLLFKKQRFPNIPQKEIVAQIQSKQKSEHKLPTWFRTDGILYPPPLNLSQSSSEATARYKSQSFHAKTLVDVTGGFGVDAFYFSQDVPVVYHLEKNTALSALAAHNFKSLGAENITAIPEDGLAWLKDQKERFDCIYIDPSRRNAQRQKVYFLEDCEPNILECLPTLLQKAETVLLKTGPLLDITRGIRQLQHVKEVHIVAVGNELKELLWFLSKDQKGPIAIKTIQLLADGNATWGYTLGDEPEIPVAYGDPQEYLYEPNAAIMKSGGFRQLAQTFDLSKLHPNSHLYTGPKLIDFPGRAFRVTAIWPFQHKILKKLGVKKANITTRNFPYEVADLRKRSGIRDGGTTYLFFTTGPSGALLIIAGERV